MSFTSACRQCGEAPFYQNTRTTATVHRCKLTRVAVMPKLTARLITLCLSGSPDHPLPDGLRMSNNVGLSSQGIVTITAEGTIVDTLSMDDLFKAQGLPTGVFGGLSVVPTSSSLRGGRKPKMDARKAQCQLMCSHEETCLKKCYGANYAPGKLAPAPSSDPIMGRAGFVLTSDKQRNCVAKCSYFEGTNEDLLRGCYHRCR